MYIYVKCVYLEIQTITALTDATAYGVVGCDGRGGCRGRGLRKGLSWPRKRGGVVIWRKKKEGERENTG